MSAWPQRAGPAFRAGGGERAAEMTAEVAVVPRIDSDHLSRAFHASLASTTSEYLLDTQTLTVDDVNRLRSARPSRAPASQGVSGVPLARAARLS